MIELKNILVPTDFSETAAVALRYAKPLAERFGASLHVLHVLEDPLLGWKPEGHVVAVPKIRAGMEQGAHAQMGQLLSDEERTKFHAEMVMLWGRPFVEVVRYAADHGIDLIVMGTHGRTGLSHLMMGSVAEKVIRLAPCPVMVVGQQTAENPAPIPP